MDIIKGVTTQRLDSIPGSAVGFTPGSGIFSTNVQDAIIETLGIIPAEQTVVRKLNFYLPGDMSVSGGNNDDGYYIGASASGVSFGAGVSINKVSISAITAPSGTAIELTIHNISDATSSTAELSVAQQIEETLLDPPIEFDDTDMLAIQVTQVGSTLAGGDLNVTLEYS